MVDDVALPIGRFRLRPGGSAGGHNGLKSIEGALRSPDTARLRIGGQARFPRSREVWRTTCSTSSVRKQRSALNELLDPMCEAVECWVLEGIEAAMNRFNSPKP